MVTLSEQKRKEAEEIGVHKKLKLEGHLNTSNMVRLIEIKSLTFFFHRCSLITMCLKQGTEKSPPFIRCKKKYSLHPGCGIVFFLVYV